MDGLERIDEQSMTDVVTRRLGGATSPRVREVSEALVRHLHAFVREIEPTMEEWWEGIDFLTRTGHMCSATRQEFVLLSDTLGVSMLVDAINHRMTARPSRRSSGPSTSRIRRAPSWERTSRRATSQRLLVEGRCERSTASRSPVRRSTPGTRTPSATTTSSTTATRTCAPGRPLTTRAASGSGRSSPRATRFPPTPTVRSGRCSRRRGAPDRPAHVHFMITARGCRPLVTHQVVIKNEYLGSDAVFAVKESLICELERLPAGIAMDLTTVAEPYARLAYDFVLVDE